jgi:hypothetical protein
MLPSPLPLSLRIRAVNGAAEVRTMLVTCWSVKGGSGTTVVAVALALLAAERSTNAWLVDLTGDAPAALGIADSSGPGIAEWLGAPATVGAEALARLVVEAGSGLSLITAGRTALPATPRWETLADALAVGAPPVVVDGGNSPPRELRVRATQDLLVVRNCYLALRRASRLERQPTGVVLVSEPGRALRRTDVEHVLGAPVVAEVDWDPAVARAVDAGLLSTRIPKPLRVSLAPIGGALSDASR